ncbi:MAG: HDIG domain-containing protein [Planctomycetaceae bacterium]|nr:HDIG domain-containing protein [Planctomycetaceae bacterium]
MANHPRTARIIPVNDPDTVWSQASRIWQSSDFWGRIGFVLVAVLLLWAGTEAWRPAFPYRWNSIPLTAPHARVDFEIVDEQRTSDVRSRARLNVLALYELDSKPLEEVRNKLQEHLFRIQQAKEFAELDLAVWSEFLTEQQRVTSIDEQSQLFQQVQNALKADPSLEAVSRSIQNSLNPFFERGLLDQVQHELDRHSVSQIRVYSKQPTDAKVVNVDDVRISLVKERLKQRLAAELRRESTTFPETDLLINFLSGWFEKQTIPSTLRFASEETKRAADLAESQVPPQFRKFRAGEPLISGPATEGPTVWKGQPLTEAHLSLLQAEHEAFLATWTWPQLLNYIVARIGLFVAVFALVGIYLWYDQAKWLIEWRHFLTLLLLLSVAIVSAYWLWRAPIRAEILPIALFAMVITILYRTQLSLLLSAALCLVMVFSMGQGLGEFVTMASVACICSFLAGNVRSRTRLIFVGLWAAVAGIPTAIYVKVALGWTLSTPIMWDSLWMGLQAIFAGVALTALLPFLEKIFDFQTDISLLELGVPTHPLLADLVQRAPGTYNHSISLAAIAETAANAIGANGVLVRVGAYFHDIGKVRKPEYFVENQAKGQNRHQMLLPSMSTLVIVAHVKDGAEMARQYKLPKPIIDMIEQHHGTTLVEYFYRQAKSEERRETGSVEESDFRYPGPKPQTREAAVIMLADACESASRAMKEATPARLEGLVQDLLQKRLRDGQFDECGITLKELHIVQESLIKSLNAMHHSRISYPDARLG